MTTVTLIIGIMFFFLILFAMCVVSYKIYQTVCENIEIQREIFILQQERLNDLNECDKLRKEIIKKRKEYLQNSKE